jgi:hypothetical protein
MASIIHLFSDSSSHGHRSSKYVILVVYDFFIFLLDRDLIVLFVVVTLSDETVENMFPTRMYILLFYFLFCICMFLLIIFIYIYTCSLFQICIIAFINLSNFIYFIITLTHCDCSTFLSNTAGPAVPTPTGKINLICLLFILLCSDHVLSMFFRYYTGSVFSADCQARVSRDECQ